MTEEQFIDLIEDYFKRDVFDREVFSDTYDTISNSSPLLQQSEQRETLLRQERNDLREKLNNHIEANHNLSRTIDQMKLRFQAKLMAAYYLFDSFTYQSTHREKGIVVNSLKKTFENMINEGDNLPFRFTDGGDDLPF